MNNLAERTEGFSFHPSILRAYDIRGIVGETLSNEDALVIGKSFASYVIRNSSKAAADIRSEERRVGKEC